MPCTFVTALYVIPTAARPIEFYLKKLEQLVGTGIPLVCYLDASLEAFGKTLCEKYPNLKIPQYVTLDISWVPENAILPCLRHPPKDNIPYFCVQLQKLWCLQDAAKHVTTPHTAWIDAGILHIFHSVDRARELLHEVARASWPQTIYAPGGYGFHDLPSIWISHPQYHALDYVWWHYLGGFLLGPTSSWNKPYEAQQEMVHALFPRFVWEVNYWALMNMYTRYLADHNETLIANVLQFRLA